MKLRLNKGESNFSLDTIKQIEKTYNAKYVSDLCRKTKNGNWVEEPVAVFYVDSPTNSEHSNYFGMYYSFDGLMICNAVTAIEPVIIGAIGDNGEVIYSRFRHDYRTTEDVTAMIDGGRDYSRISGHAIPLKIVKAEFVIETDHSDLSKWEIVFHKNDEHYKENEYEWFSQNIKQPYMRCDGYVLFEDKVDATVFKLAWG